MNEPLGAAPSTVALRAALGDSLFEDSAVPRECECATHIREQKWKCTPE